jgi:hypothetical protein
MDAYEFPKLIPTTGGTRGALLTAFVAPFDSGPLMSKAEDLNKATKAQIRPPLRPCTSFALMSDWTRRAVYHPDSVQWWVASWATLMNRANQFTRRFVALSLGVTILFVAYILYWNRLLASLACFCLRLATWDRHSPGSFWIEAGQSRTIL